MHIVLVRHAQPETVIDADTVADPGLSALGRWQAERLCAWLAHEPFDVVITSPKARAIQTVAALIESGTDHRVVDDLDEIDRGSRTYFPTELLMEQGGAYFQAIVDQRWDEIGWDPPEVFAGRVLAAFAALVAERPGDRILVASHGGVMNRWLNDLYRPAQRTSFNIPYAAITRVQVDPDADPVVLSLNETGHFDGERTGIAGPMRTGLPYRGLG